jgi:phosphatidylserine/phosphatidylglycerophosphate/cardiolipin synthase-like enzyme
MEQLRVAFGSAARDALCAAFDTARERVDLECYSLSDPAIIASLNAAAARHVAVSVHVEAHPSRYGRKPDTGERPDTVRPSSAVDSLRRRFVAGVTLIGEDDPNVLMHGKAAVVDGRTALLATANLTACGFESPGEVLVTDDAPKDVAAVAASISGSVVEGDYVVSGPAPSLRVRLQHLLGSPGDLRIASEDLSDERIVGALESRSAAGHHDRVLIEADCRVSRTQYRALAELRSAGIDVRTLPTGYMHEKYVDGGDEIYVGSANLTRNGLEEARELGIVAPAAAFGPGAQALRAGFDAMWSSAVPA